MAIRYMVLTQRYIFKDLTKEQMIRKVSVYRDLCIPYEVYKCVEIIKVDFIKLKI